MISTLQTLLNQLGELGIVLWVETGRLRFKAPTGVMTPDLQRRIKDRRNELVEFLADSCAVRHHPKYTTTRLKPDVQVLHRNVDCTSWLWWQHVGGQHACVLCHPPTHLVTVATTNHLGPIPIVNWRDCD